MSGEPEPDVVDAGSDDDDGGAACASDSKDAGLYALGVELGSVTASGWALRQEEEASERGEDVLLTFSLPDGSVDVRSFPLGQVVALVKQYVQEVSGIPYECLQLYLHERVMIDPLSLNDFPSLVAEKAGAVRVAAVDPPVYDD